MRNHPRLQFALRVVVSVVALSAATGCGRKFIATPNLYASGIREPFQDVAAENATPEARILYVTDRAPREEPERPGRHYGWKRSRALALGECLVSFSRTATWDDLVADAKTSRRKGSFEPKVTAVEELITLPATPYPVTYNEDGTTQLTQEAIDAATEAAVEFDALLDQRLALTDRKDVFLFVHGFNNTFEDAAIRMAELWHYLGREGVPILYSWPAGRGGMTGYAYDRESGEFTVFHLRQLLGFLGRTKAIENIHIIAHSRGTDVATAALREILIAERAAGHDPRETLRIRNLVIAASDLDLDVVTQRLSAERWSGAIGRLTIYRTDEDRALGLSSWLFDSIARLGTLTYDEIPEDMRKSIAPRTAIIDAQVKTGFLGHSYFLDNPAVSSDLILTLRWDCDPGAENGRPLERSTAGWWIIRDDYPGSAAAEGH